VQLPALHTSCVQSCLALQMACPAGYQAPMLFPVHACRHSAMCTSMFLPVKLQQHTKLGCVIMA
jgi:hypothetical protein